jgi:hypothetical protein
MNVKISNYISFSGREIYKTQTGDFQRVNLKSDQLSYIFRP